MEVLVDVLGGMDSAAVDQKSFYSNLCEAACRFGALKRAVIFRYDDATHRVTAAGSYGVDIGIFEGKHLSVDTAPTSAVALTEDRVIEVVPPEPHDIDPNYADLFSEHAIVYVPIAAAGRWTGVIMGEPEPDASPMDDGRRDLLWTLGKTLALASMARIATFQGERARQLEERIDLARDIHDSVVQRLFGVSLVLSSPGTLDADDRARCADEVQTALADLRSALQRPLGRSARATDATLAQEIQRLADAHPGLAIQVDGEVPPVPPHLEPLAQSVLAEAVRNVRKHANARALIVRVRHDDGLFVLEVDNDGVERRRRNGPPGMGLRLAALEALAVGGFVEFGQRAAGTWQVRLAAPMESDA